MLWFKIPCLFFHAIQSKEYKTIQKNTNTAEFVVHMPSMRTGHVEKPLDLHFSILKCSFLHTNLSKNTALSSQCVMFSPGIITGLMLFPVGLFSEELSSSLESLPETSCLWQISAPD